MQLEVLFFGITADIATEKSIQLEIEEGLSVEKLRIFLQIKYPNLSNYKNYSVAVNMEYASDDVVLKTGDAVALIPPVSGG
ncbi:MAG: MoaD/ThiS family protein [Urechidicola sp.]|nr:MoaD/ThiS family protein [Urechidicola sp.]